MKKRKEPRTVFGTPDQYKYLSELKPLHRVRFHMRSGKIRFGALEYTKEYIAILDDQGGPVKYLVAALIGKSTLIDYPIAWSNL
jgi:hypothetical protein